MQQKHKANKLPAQFKQTHKKMPQFIGMLRLDLCFFASVASPKACCGSILLESHYNIYKKIMYNKS